MSYSFNIRAISRETAKYAVRHELDMVVHDHPAHANDRAAAIATASALIDLLEAPKALQEISVSVAGSLCKFNGEAGFTSASLSVHASVLDKVGS